MTTHTITKDTAYTIEGDVARGWTLYADGQPLIRCDTHNDMATLWCALEDLMPEIDEAEFEAGETEARAEAAHERSVSFSMGMR